MSEHKDFEVSPGDAIRYLAETDTDEALLHTEIDHFKEKIKEAKAYAFLTHSDTNEKGKTITDGRKNMSAEIDPKVLEWKDKLYEASRKQREIWNKRKTCELIIAMWQTKSANSRRGNIT